jgi:hypothetical protein
MRKTTMRKTTNDAPGRSHVADRRPGSAAGRGPDGADADSVPNVNVFDGTSDSLANDMNVLVEGNLIKEISSSAISAPGATVIDGQEHALNHPRRTT